MAEDSADLLRAYLAQDSENGRLLLSDRGRMQAVAADVSATDPALRNAMLAIVGQQSFSRVLLAGRPPTPAARVDLLKRLDEQGIRAEVAERCVELLATAFAGAEARTGQESQDEQHGDKSAGVSTGTEWQGAVKFRHDPKIIVAEGTVDGSSAPNKAEQTPKPPGPNRAKRTLIGTAAALTITGVVLTLVLIPNRDGDDIGTLPTSTPTVPGKEGLTGPLCNGEDLGLSEAECTLATHGEYDWIEPDTCEPFDEVEETAVRCDGVTFSGFTPEAVFVYQKDGWKDVNDFVDREIAKANADNASLTDQGAVWNTWSYTDDDKGKTRGRIVAGTHKNSFVSWTFDKKMIAYSAKSAPKDLERLKKWWIG